jgi:integrative and conjugative element protein (TIGR02256 family)
LNFRSKEIDLNIEIAESLIEKIRQIGLKHYPKEFGGIFIGNYSQDKKTVLLEDTLLPKKYKSSKYSFERGSAGLKEKLLNLYNQEKPQLYVGEWHTHPDSSVTPSITDVAALNEIVQHDEVNICNPIMLIVGLTVKKIELGFYVYFKNKIYKYETI